MVDPQCESCQTLPERREAAAELDRLTAERDALRERVAGLERIQEEYKQATIGLLQESVAFAERVQVALSPEDVATVRNLRIVLDAALKGER